jgi:hypothetical protein
MSQSNLWQSVTNNLLRVYARLQKGQRRAHKKVRADTEKAAAAEATQELLRGCFVASGHFLCAGAKASLETDRRFYPGSNSKSAQKRRVDLPY